MEKISYNISYGDKQILRLLHPMVLSLEYKDILEGRASSIALSLQDETLHFAGAYFPKVEDKLSVQLGYGHAPLLNCGNFFIDEVQTDIGRAKIMTTIRGLSLPATLLYNKSLPQVYNQQPFAAFAHKIAAAHGLSLKGDLAGNVNAAYRYGGLAELYAAAKALNKVMKIENNTLHILDYEALKRNYALTLHKENIHTARITHKAEGRYKKCTCWWYDAKTKKRIVGSHTLPGTGAEATIWEQVKDSKSAQKRAQNWLEDRQKKCIKIEIDLKGDVRLLSGIPIQLQGFGKADGAYLIHEATHTISRNSYQTHITLQ